MHAIPTAHRLHRGSTGPADDTVTLDYEGRFLRRRLVRTDGGAEVLVDLPETVSLEEGDALETGDGRWIAVRAAPEPLLEIRGEGMALARLAWHIGNRHTPARIEAGRILIRDDRVMADMLARLGAHVHAVTAPFAPEGGAYGHGRTHGHHQGPAEAAHDHVRHGAG
jgi:urease accessory protein